MDVGVCKRLESKRGIEETGGWEIAGWEKQL